MKTDIRTRNTRAVLRFVKDAHKTIEHEQYYAKVYGQEFSPFESVDKGTALEFLTLQDVIIWC